MERLLDPFLLVWLKRVTDVFIETPGNCVNTSRKGVYYVTSTAQAPQRSFPDFARRWRGARAHRKGVTSDPLWGKWSNLPVFQRVGRKYSKTWFPRVWNPFSEMPSPKAWTHQSKNIMGWNMISASRQSGLGATHVQHICLRAGGNW